MSVVLITKKEAAEIIGLHPEHLMRLSRQGKAPRPIRYGASMQHSVRYLKSEIDAWIADKVEQRDKFVTASDKDKLSVADANLAATGAYEQEVK